MVTGSSSSSLGYLALYESFGLRCPAPRVSSRTSTSARTVNRTIQPDGNEEVTYPRSAYRPRSGLADHLEFALKNEPLDLAILSALFEREESQGAIQDWLAKSPASRYARTAGHLFEWLTGKAIEYRLPAGAARVPLLDPDKYVVGPSKSVRRFGVIHNLIGDRALSPLVRRTPVIETLICGELKQRVASAIAAIDPQLLERAVNFMYLSETRSSFAIEKEVPDHDRGERFRRLLEQAGSAGATSQDDWVRWHGEIVSAPQRREFSYRTKQNWLSRGGSSRSADYIPPSPDDVDALMQAVSTIAEQGARGEVEAVVAASCASFAMVFVHPFLDGNGRLHRFFLHHVLRQCAVTPKGMVLPVSATLLAKAQEYAAVLQAYSQPRTRLLEYQLEPDSNTIHIRGPQPAWLYSYFDATKVVELVVQCVGQALDVDLPAELDWLRAFDQAMLAINTWLSGEQSELDLLVRLIVQNGGQLSRAKRSRFARYNDREISKTEEIVREAFGPWSQKYGKGEIPAGNGEDAGCVAPAVAPAVAAVANAAAPAPGDVAAAPVRGRPKAGPT
jgi:hypothetical protein